MLELDLGIIMGCTFEGPGRSTVESVMDIVEAKDIEGVSGLSGVWLESSLGCLRWMMGYNDIGC